VDDRPGQFADTASALRALASDGDRNAWAFLVELHGPMVYRIAMRLTEDRSSAEDAVQETFIRLRSVAGDFRQGAHDPEALATAWIVRIAANCTLMHLRRQGRQSRRDRDVRHVSPMPMTEECDESDQGIERQGLYRAIGALDETDRSLVTLHHLVGIDYERLSRLFDCSTGHVRVMMHRALVRLRRRLVRRGAATDLSIVTTGSQHDHIFLEDAMLKETAKLLCDEAWAIEAAMAKETDAITRARLQGRARESWNSAGVVYAMLFEQVKGVEAAFPEGAGAASDCFMNARNYRRAIETQDAMYACRNADPVFRSGSLYWKGVAAMAWHEQHPEESACAESAFAAFTRLLREFPQSAHAESARAKLAGEPVLVRLAADGASSKG
jgi:RNA polymerase sigma-70 factor, ECF subfamily